MITMQDNWYVNFGDYFKVYTYIKTPSCISLIYTNLFVRYTSVDMGQK